MKAVALVIALQLATGPVWAAPARTKRSAQKPAAAAAVPATRAGESIAEIIRVTGQVYYSDAASGQYRFAVNGEKLFPGDRILTERGRAVIQFPDGSVIHLSKKSSFQVVESRPGRTSGARRTVSRLFAGLVRSIVKPMRGDATFVIRSASAIAAVKGTDFTFDTRRVVVFDESDSAPHAVALSNAAGTDVESVTENMTSRVLDSGVVEPPHRLESGEADRERHNFDWHEEPAPRPGDQPSETLIHATEAPVPGSPAGTHEPESAAPRTPPEAAAHAAETTLDNPVLHDAIPDASVPAETSVLPPATETMMDRATEATGNSPLPTPPVDPNYCGCD